MGKRITYVVERKYKAGSRAMLVTRSKEKAVQFYHTHKRAAYIQKHRGDRYGVTCGVLQPCVPKKIRYRGRQYTRAYTGPHTKRQALRFVKGLHEGHTPLRAAAIRTQKGWFVYTGGARRR